MSAGQKWAFGLLGVGLVSAVVFVALTLLDGCTPRRNAEFAADIAICETAPTCADAVLCRKAVAEKYGRPFSGRCEPFDAGSDR